MEFDTQTPPYATGDKTSFAYVSARDRWPVILTGAIDDTHQATAQAKDPAVHEEGKRIVEQLAKLKYELQHDRVLTALNDDGKGDIERYNTELKVLEAKGQNTWFNVPWLYAECYLYRRLHTSFSLSTHWRSYDVFAAQKIGTFRSSKPAVLELASRYKTLITSLEEQTSRSSSSNAKPLSAPDQSAADELIFREMCEICLWGNATDLSLLTTLTYADIQALQGSAARKAAEANILANDLGEAFHVLDAARTTAAKQSPPPSRRVDIVLDNAGFELFVDLVLAGYLLASGLATEIVLHPKSMPWFVSDVVPADFAALLSALQDPRAFYAKQTESAKDSTPLTAQEEADLQFLFEHWVGLHTEGKIVLRPNIFWTGPGSFWRMKSPDAKALLEDLEESELVVYKGDLSYRKLTGDAMWDPTTPFPTAIGPLGPGSNVRTLALRTCKADVIVGLKSGDDERLRAMEGGGADSGARKWSWSGKWAVVQFCDGKKK